jgi:hypothetical protein
MDKFSTTKNMLIWGIFIEGVYTNLFNLIRTNENALHSFTNSSVFWFFFPSKLHFYNLGFLVVRTNDYIQIYLYTLFLLVDR